MNTVDQLAPCPCGSGLRSAHCCAMPVVVPPHSDARRHLLPLINRATQAFRDGDLDTAERLSLDVLELVPAEREALRVLCGVCKARGRLDTAEILIRRLVSLDPNDHWATCELALMLLNRNCLAEAEALARNAVRIAPETAQSHNLLGMILTEAHKPHPGEYHYRRVIELSGRRDPILLANLAWNLKAQGRIQEARQLYQESAAVAPNVPQTLLGWARLEEADRQFTKASEILDRAECQFPDHPGLLLARTVLLRRMRQHEQALAVLQRIADTAPGDGLGPDELLEKGTILDQMGRYTEAFAAFDESKRKARALTGEYYHAEQARQVAERLKYFFTARRMQILPRATPNRNAARPIFILGFPRSGTTLVEQMLSMHPRISAGDELPLINAIADMLPRALDSRLAYPDALAELWMADHRRGLDDLRNYYLAEVRQRNIVEPGAAWFTDKMPLNEMHLGLIALLFPDAPLIHVLRHPLDAVLSAFTHHLTHGFFCAYELETAARHYRLVMDLVDHYRREIGLRYLPVRYEDIIDDPDTSVRGMLQFIGEPFDTDCLRFHENPRHARTASYAQVGERLYERSRFRYRNYLSHLTPVIPILQPVIERLGYTLD